MKTLTFNQLKKIVSEARAADSGFDVKDATIVDVDDDALLEEALVKLQEAGAAAETIGTVREALKGINFEKIMDRARAKAEESQARSHANQTKALDDAAKAYAELDNSKEATYFFTVKDEAGEAGDKLGVFLRKSKNPLGGVAAIEYVLKAIKDERFKKGHEYLCKYAEMMVENTKTVFDDMAKAGVVLPEETKWVAELRSLRHGEGKIKQYKAKMEMFEGLGDWFRGAWDWATRTYGEFKGWLFDKLENIGLLNKKADRAAESFMEVLDELNDALDQTEDNDIQYHDMAMLQESRRREARRREIRRRMRAHR